MALLKKYTLTSRMLKHDFWIWASQIARMKCNREFQFSFTLSSTWGRIRQCSCLAVSVALSVHRVLEYSTVQRFLKVTVPIVADNRSYKLSYCM